MMVAIDNNTEKYNNTGAADCGANLIMISYENAQKLSNKYNIKIKRSYKTINIKYGHKGLTSIVSEYLDCKCILGRMWLVKGASDTLIGLNTFTSKGIDIYLSNEKIKLVSKNGTVIYENEADKEQGLWRLNLHDLMIINQKYMLL